MGNHYHLMLRGSQAQLSVCMQRLNYRYALFHNDRHRMGGHVFDGPYQAHPQRSLMWALWRLAYIFLNPVTAGLADRPEDYPWSGFRSFMGQAGSPLDVSPFPDLSSVRHDPAEARAFFLDLLNEQRARGKSRGSSTPTAQEIQADQFDWICRQAEQRVRREPSVDRIGLALLWGREAGIPPRLMARILDLPSSTAVRYRIRLLEERLAADETLLARLTL